MRSSMALRARARPLAAASGLILKPSTWNAVRCQVTLYGGCGRMGLAPAIGEIHYRSDGIANLRRTGWMRTKRRLAMPLPPHGGVGCSPPSTTKMAAGGLFDKTVLFARVIREKRPMRGPELGEMNAFVAVAEQRSFAKA